MKPYVICHMLMSIYGKVTGKFLSEESIATSIERYYEINRKLTKDALALGIVTMEESFTKWLKPDLSKYSNEEVIKEDYIYDPNYNYYVVAFDRKGKLGYTSNIILDEDEGYNKMMVIEVLTENVSSSYLRYLRELNISYIFAGKEDLNMSLALEKLNRYFNINNLLLEGGSIINGAFLKENLIDELSLVIVPLIASSNDKPLFYESNIKEFKLIETNVYDDNSMYVRFRR